MIDELATGALIVSGLLGCGAAVHPGLWGRVGYGRVETMHLAPELATPCNALQRRADSPEAK
jgi:hypothetical protein